ncbi:BTAD domain-containing putative transcriptional regulator [Jiangella mangrovi]|uniref:Putative ATPase/DNA-binding SARP family transcriptional activator n=1 Tax=Jiangella mangrovi TaxID=1524084 RepID=A0A7W9LLK0_9ACTN|nr:BTAD domain-containing putative transcriptional regulator [Jiangella mangrovi]MBB5788305.1 putative ATPase/DNA-binding SARP family transcriptional activator [Jiangella mangrovi]
MQVCILGPVRVGPAGVVPGAGVRALLARLALAPGRVVGAETLVDDLWTDRPANAANAVQAVVSRLRKALNGHPVVVEAVAGGYRLAVGREDIDATAAESLLAAATAALRAGDAPAAATDAGRALDLWRGEPLADVGDAPFAATEATRLATLRLDLRRTRVEADLRRGAHADLPAELAALADDHPLDEALLVQLMRALVATGRPAEALAAYEAGRERLADALGADPGPQLRAVHLAVLNQDRSALRLGTTAAGDGVRPAPTATPLRLRRSATPLLGRDDELAAVEALLGDARLVTLLGPGGVGKTRFATEVALRRVDRTGRPVHLVELAGLRAAEDVLPAVLTALGVREVSLIDRSAHPVVRSPVERLREALADSDALLVVDNCEHLVEAVAPVVHEMVTASAEVRVLATSRTPLAVDGEVVHPLPALALPPDGVDQLGYPAVRLFHDRARAARPAVLLDPAVVADVCRHLDGLPLAIELAAAKVRSMSVEQIAARLDDRFGLLVDGPRTAPERHRTLLAVVRWSWELLDKGEQAVLRRLSVLPGGADAATAAAVCGYDGVLVDPALAGLVDQSLLVVDESGGVVRFRLLETVREFADAELLAAGERAAATDALVAWAAELTAEARPHLRGPGQVTWAGTLAREHDNLVAGLRAAIDGADSQAAYTIAATMCWYWAVQGLHSEVSAWAAQVLELTGPVDDDTVVVLCSVAIPNLLIHGADRNSGATMLRLRRIVSSGRVLDPVVRALGEMILGAMNPRPERQERVRAAVAAADDPWIESALTLFDSFTADNDGRPEDSRRLGRTAFEGFSEIGDQWGVGMAAMTLGMNEAVSGDGSVAVGLLDQAVRSFEALGARMDGRQVELLRAIVRIRAGDVARGVTELTELLDAYPGDSGVVTLAESGLGEAAARMGDPVAMLSHYEDAVAAARAPEPTGPLQLRVVALAGAAMARLRTGDEDVDDLLDDAFGFAIADGDRPVIGLVAVAYGRIAQARGDATRAARLIALGRRLSAIELLGDITHPALAELPEPDERLLGAERDRVRDLTAPAVVREIAALVRPDEDIRTSGGRPAP